MLLDRYVKMELSASAGAADPPEVMGEMSKVFKRVC
jgi:hypothetical protein